MRVGYIIVVVIFIMGITLFSFFRSNIYLALSIWNYIWADYEESQVYLKKSTKEDLGIKADILQRKWEHIDAAVLYNQIKNPDYKLYYNKSKNYYTLSQTDDFKWTKHELFLLKQSLSGFAKALEWKENKKNREAYLFLLKELERFQKEWTQKQKNGNNDSDDLEGKKEKITENKDAIYKIDFSTYIKPASQEEIDTIDTYIEKLEQEKK